MVIRPHQFEASSLSVGPHEDRSVDTGGGGGGVKAAGG